MAAIIGASSFGIRPLTSAYAVTQTPNTSSDVILKMKTRWNSAHVTPGRAKNASSVLASPSSSSGSGGLRGLSRKSGPRAMRPLRMTTSPKAEWKSSLAERSSETRKGAKPMPTPKAALMAWTLGPHSSPQTQEGAAELAETTPKLIARPKKAKLATSIPAVLTAVSSASASAISSPPATSSRCQCATASSR